MRRWNLLLVIGYCLLLTSCVLPGKYESVPMLDEYAGENRPGGYFDPHIVHYMSVDERRNHLVFVGSDGLLRNANGYLITSGDTRSAYVMDPKGRIYLLLNPRPGRLHHSTMLAGEPVASAGDLDVVEGRITYIDNRSGHYRPPPEKLEQFLSELESRGVDLGEVVVSVYGILKDDVSVPHLSSSVKELTRVDSNDSIRRCGVQTPEFATSQRVSSALKKYVDSNPQIALAQINIPVAFHVIHDGVKGKVSEDKIDMQLNVLNKTFGGMGLSFTKKAVTYTDNSAWHEMPYGELEERQAKSALGSDPSNQLNFYIVDTKYRELGWASWPWDLRGDPKMDGVVVRFDSLPGGTARFDLGYTGVHEVGHWLGLYHTFHGWVEKYAPFGGCNSPGDRVNDTPLEGSPYEGPGPGATCPAASSRDTCPYDSGFDPIDNYMNYTDDRCMNSFTTGQQARLRSVVGTYRANLQTNVVP